MINIYTINFVSIIFYYILVSIANRYVKKIENFFYCIASIQLFLLVALRNNSVGTDTYRYCEYFEGIRFFGYTKEFGYGFLMKGINFFSSDYRVFLFITAALSIIPICIFIYKTSSNAFISLLIYISFFYNFSFSGIRQSIALSFLVGAVSVYFNKPKLSLILIFIATSFHYSSMVFLCIYFKRYLNVFLNKISILSSFVIAIFFLSPTIGEFFIKFFYSDYTISQWGSDNYMLFSTGILSLYLFFVLKLNLHKNFSNTEKLSFFSMQIAFILFPTISHISNALRLVNIFYFFSTIGFVKIISFFDTTSKLIIQIFVITFLLSFYVYLTAFTGDLLRLHPYTTYLSR